MKKTSATLLGFIAASVLPAAYLAVVFPLSGYRDPQSILGSFLVVYYFAAAATVILGVPAYLVLEKFNLVTWWSATGCGALAGLLTALAVTSNSDQATQSRFAVLGAVAGLLFWSIWKAGRT